MCFVSSQVAMEQSYTCVLSQLECGEGGVHYCDCDCSTVCAYPVLSNGSLFSKILLHR